MPQIIELGPLPTFADPGYPTEATAYGPTAPTRAESDFTDGSGAIFSFYLERAEQEDNEMTESWRGDADGILVFTGLFSATVATFLVVSLQSLTQNSQDTSAFYLARLYQLSAANGPNGSVPIPLPSLSDPSSFSPSASAVWVNILWFLSLVISLTCALLATLLQQWARRYLRLARLPRALDKRARIRSFIREGVDKFYLPSVVEALPGLLHVSVFLFFAGLAIFLSGINSIVFKAILSSISVSAGMYLCATLMPLFRHDSPYHTSLSTLFWFLGVGVQQTVLSILNSVYKRVHRVEGPQGWSAFDRWRDRVTRRSRRGMVSEVERIATGWWLWHVHARAIQVFIQTLDEDHEIERLVAGIPGLFNSRVIPDLSKEALMEEIVSAGTLGNTIIGFMRRSLLSNNISEYTRLRRVKMCTKTFRALPSLFRSCVASVVGHIMVVCDLTSEISPCWIALGHLMGHFANDPDPVIASNSQFCAVFLAERFGRSDPGWTPLMAQYLGVTEPVLHRYLSHGDSLTLAYTIHIIRSHLRLRTLHPNLYSLFNVVDIHNTLPELQHEFCKTWNELVAWTGAQDQHSGQLDNPVNSTAWTLRRLELLFFALHGKPSPSVPRDECRLALCVDPTHLHAPPSPHLHGSSAHSHTASSKHVPDPVLPRVPSPLHSNAGNTSSVSLTQAADPMATPPPPSPQPDILTATMSFTGQLQGQSASPLPGDPLSLPRAPEDDAPLSSDATSSHGPLTITPLPTHAHQAIIAPLDCDQLSPQDPEDTSLRFGAYSSASAEGRT